MTFWYMARVGTVAYSQHELPRTWHQMTSMEAGQNATKQALDFVLTRPLTQKQFHDGTRLYNIYCYGFTVGIDNDEFLSTEDVRMLSAGSE